MGTARQEIGEGDARQRACAVATSHWRGSGTLVGEALVLTSGQVRPAEAAGGPDGIDPHHGRVDLVDLGGIGNGTRIEVRLGVGIIDTTIVDTTIVDTGIVDIGNTAARPRTVEAKVVWDAPDSSTALLRLVGLAGTDPVPPQLPWGEPAQLSTGAPADVYGYTYPDGPQAPPTFTHLHGVINPISQVGVGWFDLAVASQPTEIRPGRTLPWAGLAGAGVFCEDTLVGVVVHVPGAFASRRLSAIPVTRLVNQPGFREAG